jgi:hypothetical protein
MPENRDDRMMLTLDALRRDVERTPLADSLTVRRRGDQRTRRQAVGGALAVVALVAGAAGIYGGLDGGKRATEVPASPSPSAEQLLDLAADPFLTVADVGTVGPYSGFQRRPAQVASDDGPGDTPKMLCMGAASDWAAWGATTHSTEVFYSDLDASFHEHVLAYDSAAAAAHGEVDIRREVAACQGTSGGDDALTHRAPEPLGDAGFRASSLARPPDSEVSYYELAVSRRANVVVVLEWSSMGNPGGESSDTWVWTPARTSTALDRAVG